MAEVTGNLLLASDHFYREFSDDPTVMATAQALPQMGGSGWVRICARPWVCQDQHGEAAQGLPICY